MKASVTESICSSRDARWKTVLPASESVFGSSEFAQVVEEATGYEAGLYVLEDCRSRSLVAYPFFLRPITPSSTSEQCGRGLSDSVSPEYTGPLVRGPMTQALAADFPGRFSELARQKGIVTEFIHLHPWKSRSDLLEPTSLHFDREIIYVDLTLPAEHHWRASFTHACRKNIKRSQAAKVRVFEARTKDDVRQFYRVYIETMKLRHAENRYYFSLSYFTSIFDQLGTNARFSLAEYNGSVIAGTLYLHDRDDVYAYLGGADPTFQQFRPTNAIVYDAIVWGQKHGKKRLILGGGHSPEDGILRFKSSFSRDRSRFFVYKRIHLADKYDILCRSWSAIHGQQVSHARYFPQYRAVA